MTKKIKTIVFAVGGRGQRIVSYFKSIGYKGPKPLYLIKGKPLISWLIDMSFSLGFQRVFLLSNFYEEDILSFVKEHYYKDSRIKVVRRSRFSTKNKVPPMIYSLRDKLREPFIYSDGNIFYNRKILSSLMSGATTDKDSLIDLAVSRKDQAKTHLGVRVRGSNIVSMDARIKNGQRTLDKGVTNYCSLGLMVINPKVFKLFPSLGNKVDLDLVVQEIFSRQLNSGKKYIKITKYRGKWLAVHEKRDIDKILEIL